MEKKRIIFVHQILGVGGAEELRLTLLKYMDRRKYDIELCCIEAKGEIGAEIENLGFKVFSLRKPCRIYDLRITADLYRLMKKRKYDIAQTSLFYANFHGRIAAKLSKVPIIIAEEHDICEWKGLHPSFILADRLLAKFTDRIITCAKKVKDYTARQEKIPGNKFLPIPNCIDPWKFDVHDSKVQLRRDYGFCEDDRVMGIVASLCEKKGHRYLIEAMTEVVNTFDNCKLLVIGDGPLKEDLKRKVKELNLGKNINFVGITRDIPKLLNMMDLFILPSLWEGIPISILEAMYVGLPIVATNVDSFPECVVHGETGILVPPRNPRRLAEAMIGLLKDRELAARMGAAGRKRALENFTPERYIKKLENLYNDCLKNRQYL